MQPEEKISRAKMQLILTEPFFATLVLSVNVTIDDSIKTAAIDGENIKLNAEYIAGLEIDQLKALLCSGVMKIASLHHLRRNGRDQTAWNKATDYAVNSIVRQSNMRLPTESLISDKYKDMPAEQIFSLIQAENKPEQQPQPSTGENDQSGNQQQPQQQNGPGAGIEVQDGPAKTETEKQQQESDIKNKVAQAAMIGKKAGKLPEFLARMVEEILEPTIDWKEVVSRFIADRSYNDYSFSKPNTRFLHTGFILPSLYNEEPGRFAFIVDVSGSMDDELFNAIGAEIKECCTDIKSPLHVIYVNTQVTGVLEIEPGDDVKLEAKGRGGTDFAPGFDYIDEHQLNPTGVIYLTDGDCKSYPDETPDYHVLWIIYNNKKFNPPFGEVLHVKN